MTQPITPPSDAVSEVLRSFAVKSTVFCVSELRAPWAFRVHGEPVAKFHLVLEGSALLVAGTDAVTLGAGDLVVLPRGVDHTLADDPASPVADLDRLLADHGGNGGSSLRYGGGGSLTRLLCGGFSLADDLSASTLAGLPEVLHVDAHTAGTTWLAPVLDDLNEETLNGRPGANAIVAKLADLLLAQALRSWLVDGGRAELADPRLILDGAIAKAVDALNDRSSEAWSVDRLAKHVGLSRTALAVKFRELVGQSPMQYLTDVRLRRAAGSLSTGRQSVGEVARRAGYDSQAAFAKAFKRRFGVTPAAYRAQAARPPRIEIAALD
jgi:AraC-like DNA-binding protein